MLINLNRERATSMSTTWCGRSRKITAQEGKKRPIRLTPRQAYTLAKRILEQNEQPEIAFVIIRGVYRYSNYSGNVSVFFRFKK